VGQHTSSGYVIDRSVTFVALPSIKALHRHVRVTNPENHATVIAEVLDVGPHSDRDDEYVFGGKRPLAERGISKADGVTGKAANNAGIDLGERVWGVLGMKDNGPVEWTLLDE
jgi:hypothetical protein